MTYERSLLLAWTLLASASPAALAGEWQVAQMDAIAKAIQSSKPKAVSPADVLFGFDPALGLKGQKVTVGYEAAGVNTASNTAADAIDYLGEPRISLVPDPTDKNRKVLRLKQLPDDPQIAGQPRTELNFYRGRPATSPPRDSWFWRVWQVYLPNWTPTDATYIVAQIHSTAGRNPPMALAIRSGRYTIDVRSATKVPMTQADQVHRVVRKDLGPAVTGRWTTIVQHVRLDPEGGGLQTWIDGEQVLDYRGPFGYADGEHYFKQGMYPLDSKVGQEMLLRGPWFVRDSGYEEPQLRAWMAGR
ncbi:polysaccharide lyase [Caldimonas sp. KR1-144]|uniref:polysaccharide lyase n=1 Tax=Caldimonas sp. KR1-144 TaxID=3400911 RepID=UPI003BFC4890